MGSSLIKIACALVCLAGLTSCQKQPDNKRQGGADAKKGKSSAEGRRSYRNMEEYRQSVKEELAQVTENVNNYLKNAHEGVFGPNSYGKSSAKWQRHESAPSPSTVPPAKKPPVTKPPVTKPAPERARRAIGPLTVKNPYVKSQ